MIFCIDVLKLQMYSNSRSIYYLYKGGLSANGMKYQISKYFNTISKCIWQKEQLYKSSPHPLGNSISEIISMYLGILLSCSLVMTVGSETAYFVNMMNSTLISCQVEEGKSKFA